MTEKLFVAKSGKNFSEWLPLCVHLNDTAEIMKHLLEEFVSDSFSFSCGLDKNELYKTALFVAGVHDIGKATVAFQFKISHFVPERFKALEHYIKMPDFMDSARMRITPHALAGEIILRYFGCPSGVATIVGAHHGIPSDIDDICKQNLSKEDKKNIVGFENYFGNDEKNHEIFKSVWKSFIDEALEISGLTSLNELPELNSHAQMILCGLLIMADWIASNVNLFPLISVDDNAENINYSERSETAWEKLDFPDMWKSMRKEYSNTEFKNVFGFVPNDIQKALIEIVENSEKSGIYILEAPMGCGKTEASLSSAEVLAGKFDKNGLFFGLPTQATANGLFPRIQQWSEKQSETDRHSIQLKHSSASLNEAFQHIKNGIPDEENDSGLIVHSWFCGNKKACLADFVVATVDQMLMSALKRKHVMLLHLGLSEKIVIIDEVHAYDAYMNRYLERALQWLGSYHTPVILLSATLPAKRRISLIRSYLGTKKSDKKFEENISYPVITWTDGKKICQKNLTYNGKSNSVKIKKCSTDSIFSDIINVVKNGGCVGIIVNTVKRVQHIAETIRNSITENVLLYHAQYIMPDRTLKEEELLLKTGKNSTSETRKGFVAVGTQVLEQSLDIDFDMLVTDICPVDLLLQRMGRLHRHKRDYRPDIVKKPVCYVMTDEYDNDRTGSKVIYGEWLLKKTYDILPENITLPDDISPLVQQVYNAFDESEEYKNYKNSLKKSIGKAGSFLLEEPDDFIDDTIHNLLDRSIKDCDDSRAEASVRDGISSVEVLLMQRHSDNSISFTDGTPVSAEPSDYEFQQIAKQKLRLPSCFCYNRNIDKTIDELDEKCRPYIKGWQKSYIVANQLVLFLDDDMKADLIGYNLKYSYENGLEYKKESDKNEGH